MKKFLVPTFLGLGVVAVSVLVLMVQITTVTPPLKAALTQNRVAGAEEKERVQELTRTLLAETKKVKNYSAKSAGAQAAVREAFSQNIVPVAEERMKAMQALLKKNPSAFLSMTVPKSLKDQMPEAVQPYIEEKVKIKGELNVMHIDDFNAGVSDEKYEIIERKNGKVTLTNLHIVNDDIKGVTAGSTVNVSGVKLGPDIVVEEVQSGANPTADTYVEVVKFGPAPAETVKKMAVLLVNFGDKSLASTVTKESVGSTLFTSVKSIDAYYRETTHGKIGLTGEVFGPFTISSKSTESCTRENPRVINDWILEARTAAVNAGVNLALYDQDVIVMPSNSCPFSGLSGNYYFTLNGASKARPASAAFNADRFLLAHEIGHTFGIDHASAVLSSGQISEYGDTSDVMGSIYGKTPHVNAPHKFMVGWIPKTNVLTVSESGTYTITYLEDTTTSPQVLRINPVVPTNTDKPYFLSYRRPVGFDSTDLDAKYIDKTNVHTAETWGMGESQSFRIHTTLFHKALADGQSFTDAERGVTITQTSHSSTTATVNITFGQASCVRALPTMTVTPLTQTGEAGKAMTYTFTLKNNDGSGCTPRKFNYTTANVPTGWQAAYSNITTSDLNPGATHTTVLTVTPGTVAADGTYTITAKAVYEADTTQFASKDVSYTVYSPTPVDHEPTARIELDALSGEAPLTVTFVGITSTDVEGNIASYAWNFGDNTTSTEDNPAHTFTAPGTYTVTLTVKDSANQTNSATVTITVTGKPSFTIKVTKNTGGSVSPASDTSVVQGQNQTFTLTPDTGYKVSDVKVDNVSKGEVNTFTFTNVTADHTFDVTFAPIKHSLVVHSSHGKVQKNPDATQYNQGSTVTLTAEADEGYVFSGWSGDQTGAANPVNVTMSKAKTITAIFTEEVVPIQCVDADSDGINDYDKKSCPTGKDVCVATYESLPDKSTLKPTAVKYNTNHTPNQNLRSFPNFRISTTSSQVEFKSAVNLVSVDDTGCFKPVNLDTLVDMTDKKISIDSVAFPELNKPATLTFYNVDADTFEIKKDGVVCGEPQCKVVSYNKNTKTLVVEVQGFSTYEVSVPEKQEGFFERLWNWIFGN